MDKHAGLAFASILVHYAADILGDTDRNEKRRGLTGARSERGRGDDLSIRADDLVSSLVYSTTTGANCNFRFYGFMQEF